MISIIIPTLNEESVIEKTITALKAKLTIPHEIIVSDGKSTDKTVEMARKYADKVVVHNGKSRQNIAMGRNAGAKEASGEFLVFLDADCSIFEPDSFFTYALTKFTENPSLVALTTRVKVLKEQETLADKLIFGIVGWDLTIKNNIFHIGEAMGEFQMIRKDSFRTLHGFIEDLVTREDADMFLRLSKIGKTILDRKLIVYHTGRRAHKIGWFNLLKIWTINTYWVAMFDKAKEKEWTVIR